MTVEEFKEIRELVRKSNNKLIILTDINIIKQFEENILDRGKS